MRLILTACTKEGKLIILTEDYRRTELREWRQTEKFYCPQCENIVHLKVGDVVIPHFAHQKRSTCTSTFAEGESPQHLSGKRLLYQLLSARADHVILEPVIREIAQRPDLLVTAQNVQIPIEFQCSTIPLSLLQLRTEGFRRIGMDPVWILHTPVKLINQPLGIGIVQLSKFQEWFIQKNPPEGNCLLTFNPQTKSFHYFSHLMHVTGQRYIGIHQTLPIRFQQFPFAQPKILEMAQLHAYVVHYNSLREKGLQQSILLNRKGVQNPFLKSCYELRVVPVELPKWIGIPTHKSDAFREADYDWQLRLIHFMRRGGMKPTHMRNRDIERFVQQFKNPTTLKVSACREYINFLNQHKLGSDVNETEYDENLIMKLISARFLAKEVLN